MLAMFHYRLWEITMCNITAYSYGFIFIPCYVKMIIWFEDLNSGTHTHKHWHTLRIFVLFRKECTLMNRNLIYMPRTKYFQYSVQEEGKRIWQKYFYCVAGMKADWILRQLININMRRDKQLRLYEEGTKSLF